MNSTAKVLWILNRLGEAPYEMGVTELANEMETGKSGIYKILNILAKEGFVSQNTSTKKYYLGPALYRLGNIYSDISGIWEIAEPVMSAISKITQENVSIGIREGDNASLAYRIESPHAIGLHRKIGKKFPMNAGATGKILAAYHEPTRVNKLLEEEKFEKITPNTIVDKNKLLEEYQKIREQGYAFSNEEHTLGLFGMSAPIRDKYGKVWACLCLAGPKSRFTDRKIKNWLQLVINGAEEISFRLGYQSD